MSVPSLEQRLALRQCPTRQAVMHQRWDNLLFLHWEIDAEIIQDSLPPGLWVDRYQGKAYVAIVPFKMRGIRPHGLPAVPYLSNFLETNVRTYVHNAEGVPGVWFYSLDTDRWIAHWIAKRFFHLPYVWSRMSHKGMHYEMTRHDQPQSARHAFEPEGELTEAEPGTLDFFLLERYLLYSYAAKKRQLLTGQVHHRPYETCPVSLIHGDTTPLKWNGFPEPSNGPVHQCYSPGVEVDVFPVQPI